MKKLFLAFTFLFSSMLYGQVDCNDQGACNYDAQAVGASECLYENDPCDDGNPSTINDLLNDKCACLGTLNLPTSFSIEDACNCSNPNHIDLDDDGMIDLIYETVIITASAGQIWTTTSPTGILDINGNALSSVTAVENDPGVYTANFYHAIGAGYFSSWTNGTDTQVIFNSCDACAAPAAVPTMSQWGLILLSLLTLTFITLSVSVRQVQLANGGSSQMNMIDWQQIKSYPFDKNLFIKAAKFTAVLLFIVTAATLWAYGSLAITDVFGFAITTPIFVYFIHLLFLAESQK